MIANGNNRTGSANQYAMSYANGINLLEFVCEREQPS